MAGCALDALLWKGQRLDPPHMQDVRKQQRQTLFDFYDLSGPE